VNISFVTPGDETLASVRYRMLIPAEALIEMGHAVTVGGYAQETGVYVFSKHNPADLDLVQILQEKGNRVAYDVCDDHFADKYSSLYRAIIEICDIVTCSTQAMRESILSNTGRDDAIVIDDPYEFPEEEPIIKKPGRTMWFGHKSNLSSLNGYDVNDVISNSGYNGSGLTRVIMPWSMENMMMAFDRNQIVLIPHSDERKNAVKSTNRVVESIRMGKWVSASPIRSYEQFSHFANIGNVKAGIEMYNDLPDDVLIDRIKAGQDYIRERFSPKTVANQWLKALSN
jgi:hypothetical protein